MNELPISPDGEAAIADLMAASPEFAPLLVAFRRVMGLSRDVEHAAYDPHALVAPAELALHGAYLDVLARAQAHMSQLDYGATLLTMAELKEPVDRLFDEVLVMDDDPRVRANRLGLLRSVADLFRFVADFTRLSAEG